MQCEGILSESFIRVLNNKINPSPRAADPKCKRTPVYKFNNKCYCRQHIGYVTLQEMVKVGKVKNI